MQSRTQAHEQVWSQDYVLYTPHIIHHSVTVLWRFKFKVEVVVFYLQRGDRDSELAREFSQELIPRLQQYLHVAKEHGMTIIFDVTEPNIAHPLHDHYLNISLNAVLSSGIHPSKVYIYIYISLPSQSLEYYTWSVFWTDCICIWRTMYIR